MNIKKILVITTGLCSIANLALADDTSKYPTKPITMVVAFGAGGSTDTMARIYAKYAEKYLNERVVVVNKPGAGGQIGWTYLAKSKPDGYTIGLINSPVIELYPFTRADSVSYKLSDFEPLANIVTDPGVLAVRADSPFNSLNDFVEYAKLNPNKLTVSHEGIGGDDHLAAMLFSKSARIELNMVAFNGNAESTAALLGGHIDAFEGNMSEVAAQISNGSIKALAVWSDKREKAIPNVPTGDEQGVNVLANASRGLALPANTPKPIFEKLISVTKEIVNDEGFKEELTKLNMPINAFYGDGYKNYLEASSNNFHEIWKVAPWTK